MSYQNIIHESVSIENDLQVKGATYLCGALCDLGSNTWYAHCLSANCAVVGCQTSQILDITDGTTYNYSLPQSQPNCNNFLATDNYGCLIWQDVPEAGGAASFSGLTITDGNGNEYSYTLPPTNPSVGQYLGTSLCCSFVYWQDLPSLVTNCYCYQCYNDYTCHVDCYDCGCYVTCCSGGGGYTNANYASAIYNISPVYASVVCSVDFGMQSASYTCVICDFCVDCTSFVCGLS